MRDLAGGKIVVTGNVLGDLAMVILGSFTRLCTFEVVVTFQPGVLCEESRVFWGSFVKDLKA